VAIIVVAGVLYALWIPVTVANGARLGQLAEGAPPRGLDVKAPTSTALPAAEFPFSEAKAAARTAPHETGMASVQWSPKKKNGAGAEVLLTLVPSEADAAKVRAEAVSSYVSTKAIQSNGYTLNKRFTVSGVPGASGVSFTTGGSSSTTVDEVVFRVDRAVEVAFIEAAGAQGQAKVTAFAQDQHRHLAQEIPGFSLAATSLPPVASGIFWGVTLAILLLVVSVPPTVGWIRRRRRLTRAEARRRERLARGRKVLKNQAGSPRARPPGSSRARGAPSRRR
jgi:hypothetical protein